ncbi:ap-4 complex subunit epsilon-1 [Moniliophthora roreri]|nr:ap-4 complex subunit epsilon-1 [Moniliophthora roreri]
MRRIHIQLRGTFGLGFVISLVACISDVLWTYSAGDGAKQHVKSPEFSQNTVISTLPLAIWVTQPSLAPDRDVAGINAIRLSQSQDHQDLLPLIQKVPGACRPRSDTRREKGR